MTLHDKERKHFYSVILPRNVKLTLKAAWGRVWPLFYVVIRNKMFLNMNYYVFHTGWVAQWVRYLSAETEAGSSIPPMCFLEIRTSLCWALGKLCSPNMSQKRMINHICAFSIWKTRNEFLLPFSFLALKKPKIIRNSVSQYFYQFLGQNLEYIGLIKLVSKMKQSSWLHLFL